MTTTNSSPDSLPPAIFLMGPTAAGKTGLAVELVRHLAAEIISVDSMLVYRGLDIGTAKPDAQTLATAPHRLVDIRDPSEPYSAADFRDDALREMQEISANGHIPLLVGGTMLYFRALEQGLSDMPSADPTVRAELDAEARRHGWQALHQRLATLDPQAAARIHPNDPQRIQRALEVCQISGQTMTEILAGQQAFQLPYRPIKIVLAPPERDVLRERIADRFRQMLEHGLIDEVNRLYQRGDLDPNLPAIRGVGYRQIWSYLEGRLDYDQMVRAAITATCQLAKRQMTWLRTATGACCLPGTDRDNVDKALKYIAEREI